MTIARRRQISLGQTPYYHCVSRCVRRAFLCGLDHFTGRDYSHRRQWMEDQLALLSEVFAIDLVAYAIMSNHYHVVLRVNREQHQRLSDDAIKARWGRLFAVPDAPDPVHQIAIWRERLASISWFMRCLNEPIARRANKEDRCSGRFWEGRFKLQALLDDTALLKCMVYVDLNPIRAGVAVSPENSEHTSVRARIRRRDSHLLSLTDSGTGLLPISKAEYLSLVDWSGRAVRRDKRGSISEILPPILVRLSLDGEQWTREMQDYGRRYFRAVGSLRALQKYCQHLGQNWLKGAKPVAAISPG